MFLNLPKYMVKGIVIRGAKDTTIEDCTFENLDVAIEAENARGLKLNRNRVVNQQSKNQEGEDEH